MADCKDIDAALANLASKINDYAQKLSDLERLQKQCCDNKDKKNKEADLSGINKRLDDIERYINKLDEEIKLITDKAKEIGGYLRDLLDSADSIIEKIFGSITFFSKLFNLFK